MTDFRSRLLLELEKKSAEQFKAGIKEVREGIRGLDKEVAGLAKTGAVGGALGEMPKTLDKTAEGMKQVATETAAASKQVAALDKNAANLQRRAKQPVFLQFALFPAASLAQRAGVGGLADILFTTSDVAGILDNSAIVGSSVTELATRLKAGSGPISAIATAAGNLAAPLGATAASFASLIAVAAPFVVIGAALFKVMSDMSAAFEAASKKAQAFIDAQVKVGEQIAAGATTADLQKGLASETGRRDTNQGLIDLYQPLIDERNAQLAAIAAGDMGDAVRAGFELNQRVSELTGGEITSIDELADELERLKQTVAGSSTQINAYQTALDTQAAAENDEAARRQHIGEMSLELVRRETEQRQQYNELLRSGSIQDVETQIQQEQDRLALNQALIPSLEQLAAQDEEYLDDLNAARLAVIDAGGNLEELTIILTMVSERTALFNLITNDLGITMEGAQDAFKLIHDQTEAYKKALEQLADKQDDLVRRFNEANLSAENQYYFDRDKLGRDFEADQMDATVEEQDKEAKLAQDHADDMEKIERDHQRKVAKIERDFARSAETAIAERDALAYVQAQRRRDDDLKDEQERYEDAKADREKDYQRQLDELRANLQKQQDERRRDYERRLDELRRAYEFERSERQRKYAADIQQLQAEFAAETLARNAHFAESMAALRDHLVQRFSLENLYYDAAQARLERRIAELNAGSTTSSTTTSSGSFTGAAAAFSGTVTGHAHGGDTPAYRDFVVGERGPEVLRLPVRGHVFNQQQYAQQSASGSGLQYSPTINGAGMTRREVIRESSRQLNRTLKQAGWN